MELTEERMSDGEGIRVLSEPDGKAGTQPPSTPAPVVVIEYRQASLWHRFLPALLVFLAAIPISLFQRQTPVRLIPNRSMLVTPAPASNPATTPAAVTPSPTLDTAPIVAKFADADGKSVDPDLSKTAAAPPGPRASGRMLPAPARSSATRRAAVPPATVTALRRSSSAAARPMARVAAISMCR